MKITNNLKLIIVLLITFSVLPAFAVPSGCESLANSKWFGRVLLSPVFTNGPKMPVTILINVDTVTRERAVQDVYEYHIDGTFNQYPLDGGPCYDRVSDGVLTWVDFLQLGGNELVLAKSFTSNDPTTLTIPSNAISWTINGVQYSNNNDAQLVRQ